MRSNKKRGQRGCHVRRTTMQVSAYCAAATQCVVRWVVLFFSLLCFLDRSRAKHNELFCLGATCANFTTTATYTRCRKGARDEEEEKESTKVRTTYVHSELWWQRRPCIDFAAACFNDRTRRRKIRNVVEVAALQRRVPYDAKNFGFSTV